MTAARRAPRSHRIDTSPTPDAAACAARRHVRLRVGLLVIAMLLSVFGARLFQLQGLDAKAYAARPTPPGWCTLDLPAERGRILDRNGVPAGRVRRRA